MTESPGNSPTSRAGDTRSPEEIAAVTARLRLGPYLDRALTIASALVSAATQGEVSIEVVGPGAPDGVHDGRYAAIELATTHRRLIAEGDKAQVTAAALVHIEREGWTTVEYLRACLYGSRVATAFTAGVLVAVEMAEHLAAQAGVDPQTREEISRKVCTQLEVLRPIDLRVALEYDGWDREPAGAAAGIHWQLLKSGYAGWTVDEAAQCLRGGADARAGLDDLEARLGIDVGRMREAITFIGPEVSDARLAEICADRGLAITANDEGRWEWRDEHGRISNSDFTSEREAAIAAIEEAFAGDWLDHGDGDLSLVDFIGEQYAPGNRP
ncbi:hypothetical protein [Pseudoxanthomonas kaohsiungensis]|uniref:Uncharacterized protein n=1 Tax=Pseudoxanthomonas kaohsiungensis TaxID=283923 RepID=A0ABW3LXH6_9GAMM|nr:hypothetical protein [Pseudoxanthomonas kaohsiungensis]KAF1702911.1 hypothetical protein CSC66_09050 [Pseudoxanthomonas kaohsiungensis]